MGHHVQGVSEAGKVDHDGREHHYGTPDAMHGPVRARLTDKRVAFDIVKDPRVGAGE